MGVKTYLYCLDCNERLLIGGENLNGFYVYRNEKSIDELGTFIIKHKNHLMSHVTEQIAVELNMIEYEHSLHDWPSEPLAEQLDFLNSIKEDNHG